MMREEFGTLGKTILYYRKKAGLTQAQLAERLYTKKSDISEIENDKRSMTIPRMLCRSIRRNCLRISGRQKMIEEGLHIMKCLLNWIG